MIHDSEDEEETREERERTRDIVTSGVEEVSFLDLGTLHACVI
jgi:hypothetical protein